MIIVAAANVNELFLIIIMTSVPGHNKYYISAWMTKRIYDQELTLSCGDDG